MAKSKVKEEVKHVEPVVLETAQSETVEIPNLIGDQVVIGIGGGLVTGKEYNVSADIATNLIFKGFAKLKQ